MAMSPGSDESGVPVANFNNASPRAGSDAFETLDCIALMPKVAVRLLGQPNKQMTKDRELRFGTHGSMSVDLNGGQYFDHEANFGGGVLSLIQHVRGCDVDGARLWLKDEGLVPNRADDQIRPPLRVTSTYYDYRDADGVVAYRVERRQLDGIKTFLQHGPDGHGGFHSAKGCMNGVQRIPYRLPSLLAADLDAVAYIVEGEKDAERLASLGLLATTNSGGAGKFPADHARYFTGRQVIIIADNDKAGNEHAADVASKLRGHAAATAVLHLPNLPEKGDVSDWLDAGGTVNQLNDLANAALNGDQLGLLNSCNLLEWEAEETPEREWLLPDWIPDRQTTLFTGKGSAGKSLLMQILCTCVASQSPFLGLKAASGRALYITAEDGESELHIRQKAICTTLGINMRDIHGKLHLVSLSGELGNELALFDQEGSLRQTPRFLDVVAKAKAIGARLIVIDNSAHAFGGNENDRHQVAAFANLLNRLALEVGAAVVLIAHPNKVGDSYSGSTSWENQVRSRLFMEIPGPSPEGEFEDPDARVIRREKSNYARNGEEIHFRWYRGAFLLSDEIPHDCIYENSLDLRARAENEKFLKLLAIATTQNRAVSHNPGTNHAPKIFASMPEGKPLKKSVYERAMQRLISTGVIRINEELEFRGPNRVKKYGIRLATQCTNTISETTENRAPTLALTLCTDPHSPHFQSVDIPCTDPHASTPLYTRYISGGHRGDAPPIPEQMQEPRQSQPNIA